MKTNYNKNALFLIVIGAVLFVINAAGIFLGYKHIEKDSKF